MEVFGDDMIFGNFKLSNYGLMVGSFNYKGDSTDSIGMSPSTIEEYLGHNPVPVYIGQEYSKKLEFTISLMKNPCVWQASDYFTEKDCRTILREITGKKGYQWTKLINSEMDDDYWYRARVNDIQYERVAGKVVGIIVSFECDSIFAWSKEITIEKDIVANVPFSMYNSSDDLNNYILPVVSVCSSDEGEVSIKNVEDNWETVINFVGGETITMDSKYEIIDSNIGSHSNLLNDTNLHFFRLLPDKNTYISDKNVTIKFIYREPRKVGFIQ